MGWFSRRMIDPTNRRERFLVTENEQHIDDQTHVDAENNQESERWMSDMDGLVDFSDDMLLRDYYFPDLESSEDDEEDYRPPQPSRPKSKRTSENRRKCRAVGLTQSEEVELCEWLRQQDEVMTVNQVSIFDRLAGIY